MVTTLDALAHSVANQPPTGYPDDGPSSTMIPAGLRERPSWVAFRLEPKDGRLTKIPYSARSGHKASSTDPTTWSTYELACKYRDRAVLDGIAFMVNAADPYTVIDLDHVRDAETGVIDPWAQDIIDRLASYTEISVSGTGVHIWLKDSPLPVHGRHSSKLPFECYSHARQMTVSGIHLEGTPTTIEARPAELAAIHLEVFGPPPAPRDPSLLVTRGGSQLTDEEVLAAARRSAIGTQFDLYWSGDTSLQDGDHSAADLVLASYLMFFTGGDHAQCDRLFRQSGQYRPKWDELRGEVTYGERTLNKADENRTEYYHPQLNAPTLVFSPRPPAPAPTEAAPDAWQAQVAWLEQSLATAQDYINVQDATNAELHEVNRLLVTYIRKLGGKAAQGLDMAMEVASATSRGLDQDGTVRLSPVGLAIEHYGAPPHEVESASAIRQREQITRRVARGVDHWKASGLFTVVKEAEPTKANVTTLNPRTGVLTTKVVPYFPTRIGFAVPARNPDAPADMIDFLQFVTSEQYVEVEQRGGKRQRPLYCPEHPDANLKAITKCAACESVVAPVREFRPIDPPKPLVDDEDEHPALCGSSIHPQNRWSTPTLSCCTPETAMAAPATLVQMEIPGCADRGVKFDGTIPDDDRDLEAPIRQAKAAEPETYTPTVGTPHNWPPPVTSDYEWGVMFKPSRPTYAADAPQEAS